MKTRDMDTPVTQEKGQPTPGHLATQLKDSKEWASLTRHLRPWAKRAVAS